MDQLWFEKEKEENVFIEAEKERIREQRKREGGPVVQDLDDVLAECAAQSDVSRGPWLFVSNIRELDIVMRASTRQFDPTSQISTYKSGHHITFEQGRAFCHTPEEVDFMISKKNGLGNKYVAGFNVERYKEWRRASLGLPSRSKNIPKEVDEVEQGIPVPIITDDEELAYMEAIKRKKELKGPILPPSPLPSDMPNEVPQLIIPSDADMEELFDTPMTPGTIVAEKNERLDEVESKIERMEGILEALANKLLGEPQPSPKPEPKMGPAYDKPVGTLSCRDCGKPGFTSGNAVARHKKSGECKVVRARKLAEEQAKFDAVEARNRETLPRVHTGMNTARGM